MPLYEYACQKCSHEFEALVLRDDKPTCPKCGSAELEKLISAVGGRMGEDAESRAKYALTDYGRARKPKS